MWRLSRIAASSSTTRMEARKLSTGLGMVLHSVTRKRPAQVGRPSTTRGLKRVGLNAYGSTGSSRHLNHGEERRGLAALAEHHRVEAQIGPRLGTLDRLLEVRDAGDLAAVDLG